MIVTPLLRVRVHKPRTLEVGRRFACRPEWVELRGNEVTECGPRTQHVSKAPDFAHPIGEACVPASGETNPLRARERTGSRDERRSFRLRRVQNLRAHYRPQERSARWRFLALIVGPNGGITVREALRELGVSRSAPTSWKRDPEWARRYEIAREIRADSLVERALRILREATEDPHISPARVRLTKAYADRMCWLAGKTAPLRYGNRPNRS